MKNRIRIIKYEIIVQELGMHIDEFVECVHDRLDDGWELQGGVAIHPETGRLVQAMTKREWID